MNFVFAAHVPRSPFGFLVLLPINWANTNSRFLYVTFASNFNTRQSSRNCRTAMPVRGNDFLMEKYRLNSVEILDDANLFSIIFSISSCLTGLIPSCLLCQFYNGPTWKNLTYCNFYFITNLSSPFLFPSQRSHQDSFNRQFFALFCRFFRETARQRERWPTCLALFLFPRFDILH